MKMEMKTETIHTTFGKKDFDKFFYPFTDKGSVNKNEVIMQAMKILYELCKQNNTGMNFASLLEVKRKIFRGEVQISEKIVIETNGDGKTIISIPKQHGEIIERLMSFIEDKAEKNPSEVSIIKKETDEPRNDTGTSPKLLLRTKVLKYLEDNDGEMSRKNVKRHFKLSAQSMSNVLKELRLEGKIETDTDIKKAGIIKLV